jgi:hypothetical protein
MSEISYGGIPSRPSPGKRRPIPTTRPPGLFDCRQFDAGLYQVRRLGQPEQRVTVRFRSSALMIRVSETQIA